MPTKNHLNKYLTKLLKIYSAAIVFILASLGVTTSCEPAVEYGVPFAKFIVNGTVTSSDSLKDIEGIRVVMEGDTTTTDYQGNYQVICADASVSSQTFDIYFQDIDGTVNGDFTNLDTTVEFINPQFVNGNGWYEGEATEEFNIKLDKK
jgi:putative lipoprotein (rSAM/lipoprotein system)